MTTALWLKVNVRFNFPVPMDSLSKLVPIHWFIRHMVSFFFFKERSSFIYYTMCNYQFTQIQNINTFSGEKTKVMTKRIHSVSIFLIWVSLTPCAFYTMSDASRISLHLGKCTVNKTLGCSCPFFWWKLQLPMSPGELKTGWGSLGKSWTPTSSETWKQFDYCFMLPPSSKPN